MVGGGGGGYMRVLRGELCSTPTLRMRWLCRVCTLENIYHHIDIPVLRVTIRNIIYLLPK